MEQLNFVNLIQAGIIATGVLGCLLLWLTKPIEFRGIALLLFFLALGAFINILEESGLTREIYLISPIFIMLFGPITYLAAKLLINKQLAKSQWFHLLPAIPILFFTSYTYTIIGIGTFWRLTYAVLTMMMLLKFKQSMERERSDSDDYSLNWLVWLLVITAAFNLVDLVRLNLQQSIPHTINLLGQGINNFVWLIAAMVIIIKLQSQHSIPKATPLPDNATTTNKPDESEYSSIFAELDNLVTTNQWFLRPRLTLNDLSELTGLQTRDISRAINLNTQKSFNDYVNTYRVNFVCAELSKKTERSLMDISMDAGFSSKASFNKVFKQISGFTPTEYRRRKNV